MTQYKCALTRGALALTLGLCAATAWGLTQHFEIHFGASEQQNVLPVAGFRHLWFRENMAIVSQNHEHQPLTMPTIEPTMSDMLELHHRATGRLTPYSMLQTDSNKRLTVHEYQQEVGS